MCYSHPCVAMISLRATQQQQQWHHISELCSSLASLWLMLLTASVQVYGLRTSLCTTTRRLHDSPTSTDGSPLSPLTTPRLSDSAQPQNHDLSARINIAKHLLNLDPAPNCVSLCLDSLRFLL